MMARNLATAIHTAAVGLGKGHARPASVADAEPSPSASIQRGIDPALVALQEACWEAYRLAALRQQRDPSEANMRACACAHAAFERAFCGPTDPAAAPLFFWTRSVAGLGEGKVAA